MIICPLFPLIKRSAAGFTDDYHQPSDSAEKVSPEMIQMISRLTFLTAFDMADQ